MALKNAASETDGAAKNGYNLQVHKTIGAGAGAAEWAFAALIHLAMWTGGMVIGPLSVVLCPFTFLFLPFRQALPFAAVIAGLSVFPKLPESPKFCQLFLRTASLLHGGSTLWVVDKALPHLGVEGVMVCYHPHGVIPMGFCLNGAVRAKTRLPKKYLAEETQLDHRVSGVQAPILFKIPILRQIMQLFGCTMPATKEGMFKLFRARMSFGIIPGGSEDVALHICGRERVYLKHRAGFLKYALQHGFKVMIAYNFGESDLYESVSLVQPLNIWLVKNLGFVLPLFWGRWWCPFLPKGGVPINTVFGEVLELPRIDNPSNEDVAEWHRRYMEAMVALFDRHKAQFGYASRTLEIL